MGLLVKHKSGRQCRLPLLCSFLWNGYLFLFLSLLLPELLLSLVLGCFEGCLVCPKCNPLSSVGLGVDVTWVLPVPPSLLIITVGAGLPVLEGIGVTETVGMGVSEGSSVTASLPGPMPGTGPVGLVVCSAFGLNVELMNSPISSR